MWAWVVVCLSMVALLSWQLIQGGPPSRVDPIQGGPHPGWWTPVQGGGPPSCWEAAGTGSKARFDLITIIVQWPANRGRNNSGPNMAPWGTPQYFIFTKYLCLYHFYKIDLLRPVANPNIVLGFHLTFAADKLHFKSHAIFQSLSSKTKLQARHIYRCSCGEGGRKIHFVPQQPIQFLWQAWKSRGLRTRDSLLPIKVLTPNLPRRIST